MREIAISIGGFHETTEDTDYGTLWADTVEEGLTLATAVTDGFLHTMASTSHTRRIKRTKEPKSEVLQEEQTVPIPYLKRERQASVTHSSLSMLSTDGPNRTPVRTRKVTWASMSG